MFDLLTPGKKISLLASAAVAFMMLTAFIASLTEDPANLDWASWLGYYSVLGYAVILVAGGLDFNTNKADIARVATAVFALGGVIGLVSGVMIFTMVMFILSGLAAIAACVLDYMANQKLNIVYALVDIGLLSVSDQDSRTDFIDVYRFHDVFVKPFQAAKADRPLPVIDFL